MPPTGETMTPAQILEAMAVTFRERNMVYGDNYKRVGNVMFALHPHGVVLNTPADHEMFHLWSLIVVKMTRFAVSELTHPDSIHDIGVYSAMMESILKERDQF